uniref:B box-type domain-containing protein n=2 Tax=Kalanchoe fedtschenkoi TaxID=63787 RepID=A0A7N0RIV1_KALFE
MSHHFFFLHSSFIFISISIRARCLFLALFLSRFSFLSRAFVFTSAKSDPNPFTPQRGVERFFRKAPPFSARRASTSYITLSEAKDARKLPYLPFCQTRIAFIFFKKCSSGRDSVISIMGYKCDFCCNRSSVVYCRSDDACLCLDCDTSVHAANSLSRRHSRTLVCQRCHAQPAALQCIEERVSLCQSCDWTGHDASTSGAAHKRRNIKFYSDCPSAAELQSMWSYDSESVSVSGSISIGEHEMGLMSIADGNVKQAKPSTTEVDQLCNVNPDQVWNSSAQDLDSSFSNASHETEIVNTPQPKLSFLEAINPTGDDDLFVDFDMDESELNLENYEELFRVNFSQSEELLENGGIDSLFEPRNKSLTELNCHRTLASQRNQGAAKPCRLIR